MFYWLTSNKVNDLLNDVVITAACGEGACTEGACIEGVCLKDAHTGTEDTGQRYLY